ncbi:MAG: type II toxin-antitoxin system HicB family antitoxin [Myxococcales bacterium]|nr:MAG: type II toxin-antitoxin system HicB family antitoxin [Myxococcales bacterium]
MEVVSVETFIALEFDKLAEGGYVATSPDVPGLVAQGRTIEETVEIARDVARKIAESCLEHGDPLPEVFTRPAKGGIISSLSVPVTLP